VGAGREGQIEAANQRVLAAVLLRTAAEIERWIWSPQTSGADLQEGGHMERKKLEREIYQLTQIIAANAYALVSKSTPVADRAGLQKQIDIRTTTWASLLKQLGGDSSLDTAELRGAHAQAKAYPRSEAHEGRITTNPVSPARPH
jgi:hypothetical protein